MTYWQWVLAWILYLSLTGVLSFSQATTYHPRYPQLDKVHMGAGWAYFLWWIALGILITWVVH